MSLSIETEVIFDSRRGQEYHQLIHHYMIRQPFTKSTRWRYSI